MEGKRLGHSPIVYYIYKPDIPKQEEWVLFLHAAFVDHSMFEQQIQSFRDTYSILAVDLIGHGASTHTRRGDSIEHMAAWVFEILQAEGIDTIHVLGISLGAVVAQDFANRFPQKVRSLACFGGYDINRFDPVLQKQNGLEQMKMMVRALVSKTWFAKANRSISAHTPQAQQAFYQMNLCFPRSSFRYLASLGKLVNRFPPAERMYPLLIGCGEYDIPMEHAAIRSWKENEANCEVVVLKDAGHCVNMDAPQAFNQVMRQFWQRTSCIQEI